MIEGVNIFHFFFLPSWSSDFGYNSSGCSGKNYRVIVQKERVKIKTMFTFYRMNIFQRFCAGIRIVRFALLISYSNFH